MKKLLKILVILVIIVVCLALAKNFLLKKGIETTVKALTGLPLKIGSFKFGILDTTIDIKDLQLHNPEGFSDQMMLDMPEIYIDYEFGSLLKKKLHVHEMRINVREFAIVKNEKGETNLDALKAVQTKKGEGKKAKKGEKKSSQKDEAFDIQIDLIELKLGKVSYKDYSKEGAPSIKEFNLNLDERFENVTDLKSLVGIIVFKSLTNTTIGALVNFDIKGLGSNLTGSLGSAAQAVGDTATKALSSTKELFGTSTEKLQEQAEGLKNLFKNSLKD